MINNIIYVDIIIVIRFNMEVKMKQMKNLNEGFTLAEILITLGIIGVVAALTIPTLIANTNSAKFRSQFKKSFSTLKQAGIMSQAQYGFDYKDAAKYACVAPATDNPENVMTICAIFNGTLKGISYLGKGDTLKTPDGSAYTIKTAPNGGYDPMGEYTIDKYNMYALSDGSLVGISENIGFIDVNGLNLPNQEVSCSDGKVVDTGFKKGNRNVYDGCIVPNKPSNMTDIFPIRFDTDYGSIDRENIAPATNAVEFVLNSAK